MPAYDSMVERFDKGDVLFGLSDDLSVAQSALKTAYGDGASFWNKFSRTGRAENKRAKEISQKTDVVIQASLTNAIADPGALAVAIKAAIPIVKASFGDSGAALTAPPMASAYDAEIVSHKLPNESQRGINFAEFLDGHEKYSPKLMGGSMEEGTFQPLGSKATDRQWIARSRKGAFETHLAGILDAGGPKAVLHLNGGGTRAARSAGQNRTLITDNWNNIDWSRYNMWDFLHESHLGNVVNYKVWQRTSKAGLEFQTTVRDRTVHFLLDTFLKGDNMRAVVDKSGAHGRSITAGELRWLYRNWENPRVALRTIFWTTQGRSAAPWHLRAELWKSYIPRGERNRDNSRALAASLGVHTEPPAISTL